MIKILFVMIFLTISLFSTEVDVRTKIIDKISKALVKKELITIMVTDKKNKEIIQNSKCLVNSTKCENVDIIIVSNIKNLPLCSDNVLVFATNYLTFKSLPKAIGAFFYQKGRPNIIFRKNNLKKYGITLDKEFDRYIE